MDEARGKDAWTRFGRLWQAIAEPNRDRKDLRRPFRESDFGGPYEYPKMVSATGKAEEVHALLKANAKKVIKEKPSG